MNILLNDKERSLYAKTIKELGDLCPETMETKIARANVQQAFVLDKVRELATKQSTILCVGSCYDTASESLIKLGYNVIEIDPVFNQNLDQFFKSTNKKFDIVFSTSVLEHVDNDELFVEQICKLLNPNGYGVMTCDFNDGYGKVITPKPAEDCRLYTKDDLLVRLAKVLSSNKCAMYGDINYDDTPDFQYGESIYSFATYIFKRNSSV